MRVAVVGASGFIGRHVVRTLVSKGHEVVAVSRHPDPPISPLVAPMALDVADTETNLFTRIGQPDIVLYLAWGGLPNYGSTHHLSEELPRHVAFLDACINSGLKQLIVTGTCLEYGMQTGQLEETTPASPTTAYGEAKHRLHQHLLELQMTRKFGLTWLRLFYLYGSGQASTSLYSQLRAAVSSGEASFNMSAGDQLRDFLAIETAAEYIATLTLEHADAGIVNVCSGRPVAVADMVSGWLDEWNVSIALNRNVYPYPDYEPHAFWGNALRLNSMLGITHERA